MSNAIHDDNRVPSLLAISSADSISRVVLEADATYKSLNVNVTGGISNSQYTEGDTDASITGTAVLWEDGSNTLRAISATYPLPIKSAANSGVDIGDVDVTSVVPGTAATNLGKAVGSAAGATDTGVALLAVYNDADTRTTVDDGDYTRLSATHFKELRTRDQRAIDLCNCNDYTAVTVLNADTTTLANSANHVFGTGALSFAKTDGAANSVYGGVYDTFTAIDLSEIFEAGGFVGLSCYLSSLTDVTNVFLRIGTDASNYNCWTWPVADLTAAIWLNLRKAAAQPDYSKNTGNGWSTSAIAYVAFGVEFSAQDKALAGMLFDHVHIVGGRVTATDITTTQVTTPNVNLLRVSNSPTGVAGAGAVAAGTQRVTLASDDPAVTALQIMDDWDDSNYCNVNLNVAGTDVAANAGTLNAQTLRVTIATDDEVNNSNAAIQTATELIDDTVYVDDADWTADTSKNLLVGGVTQSVPSANTDGDVTPLITNALRELRTAVPESDLATAATKHVKKYYTNAGAVTDGIVWSPAAGTRWYVTDIFINVSAAATVTLEDDLAGGDSAVWKAELAANSGWSHAFTTPLYSGEDAADLIITTSAGNVYVCVTGYEI